MSESSTFMSADGDGYELQMGRWSKLLAPLFIEFARITSGERVLDLGCGTGSLSFALARNDRFAAIHGVDFSAAYVQYATKRSSERRLKFEIGDACALRFDNAAFDHVLSLLVLQFIPNADVAVREMRRVTRPGGTVAAATWDTATMPIHRIFFEAAAGVDPEARKIRSETCARPLARAGGLAEAWRQVGFCDVVQDRLTISMDFASFDDFWAPIEGRDGPFAKYFQQLLQTQKIEVRERVREAYLDGKSDGRRSYPAHAWAVRGAVG